MVDIYPNNSYANRFHEIVKDGGYKSRLMIYSIDLSQNPIDVSLRAEVEEYGELLRYKDSDTNSNGRIAQSGIRIDNYYNKDEQYTIGNAPICSIRLALINDDGFFSTYDWEQTIIVYWDVYDTQNSMWLGCPLGIYWWERPTKTSAIVVSARANDAMYLLDQMDDYVWPDFSGGIELGAVYSSIVSGIAGIIPYSDWRYWPNMSVTYSSEPFDVIDMTRREVLAKLAEIAGANAYMSRDGYAMLKPFKDGLWRTVPGAAPTYYSINGDTAPTPIVQLEIGEYTVPIIDKFVAQVGQTGKEFTDGSGTNVMYSINNGFLNVSDSDAQTLIQNMYWSVSGQYGRSNMVAYVPISLKAYADPSVEGGDVIRVIRNGTTYLMPVFQQTLKWRGGEWTVEMSNSGTEKRTIPSKATRTSYTMERRISTLESGSGADPATVPASASIDSSGLITFYNSGGTALFTLQLPI